MQINQDFCKKHDENEIIQLAVYSVIGDRPEQQDTVGYILRENEGIITLCDGMGGHAGGRLASTEAVSEMLQMYEKQASILEIPAFYLDAAGQLDRLVRGLKDNRGQWMKAGSTIVSVFVRDKSLFWLSVGDSRIYIKRGEEFMQLTQDHTYALKLERKLETGTITREEYQEKLSSGEMLVSFLGIGGLPLIDCNENPLQLEQNDLIFLMSDGLYKLLEDKEIFNIISNFRSVDDALLALEKKCRRAAKYKKINRDNMTLALIRVK